MSKEEEIELLFNTMMQLGKLMSVRTKESYEEQAATSLQFYALGYLHENNNATITEIAAHLKLSKSSATQLIERLTTATVIERKADVHDKRITRLALTDKGVSELKIMKQKFISTLKDAFADIPKSDILELIRIHTSMIESLKKDKHE